MRNGVGVQPHPPHLVAGPRVVVGAQGVVEQELRLARVGVALQRGLVLVSEDRKRYGLVLGQDIGFNFSLSSLKRFYRYAVATGKLSGDPTLKIDTPALPRPRFVRGGT